MASEQTVEQTKKNHELIAVKLNIPELLKFDFNLKEVNDMSDKISYLSGRINGSGRG